MLELLDKHRSVVLQLHDRLARPAQRRARRAARLPRRSSDVASAATPGGRSARWPRRVRRAVPVDPGGFKTTVEQSSRPSGGSAAEIAKSGLVGGRNKPLALRFEPRWPRALPGVRRAFASDERWFQGLRRQLNTTSHRVGRIIGDGDRPLSAACPATRRALGGDPSGRHDARAGLALASL